MNAPSATAPSVRSVCDIGITFVSLPPASGAVVCRRRRGPPRGSPGGWTVQIRRVERWVDRCGTGCWTWSRFCQRQTSRTSSMTISQGMSRRGRKRNRRKRIIASRCRGERLAQPTSWCAWLADLRQRSRSDSPECTVRDPLRRGCASARGDLGRGVRPDRLAARPARPVGRIGRLGRLGRVPLVPVGRLDGRAGLPRALRLRAGAGRPLLRRPLAALQGLEPEPELGMDGRRADQRLVSRSAGPSGGAGTARPASRRDRRAIRRGPRTRRSRRWPASYGPMTMRSPVFENPSSRRRPSAARGPNGATGSSPTTRPGRQVVLARRAPSATGPCRSEWTMTSPTPGCARRPGIRSG